MKFETLRDILFMLPPETAHHLSLESIGLLRRLNLSGMVAKPVADDPVEVMGLKFANPVGLAAGLDKDGDFIDGLAALGFGFLEVGTVTPRPQRGNPRPRMFRLPEKQALINRMGFNNLGVDHLVRRVKASSYEGVLGINIGKNADTPMENALDDYESCMRKVYDIASYIVVNISSPNTPGLRALQQKDSLVKLLTGLRQAHSQLRENQGRHVPLVVKISPDMDDEEVIHMSGTLSEFKVDGVIISNTTVSRSAVVGEKYSDEAGGLSGMPLRNQANHVLQLMASHVPPEIALIGVGGIMSGPDAAEKVRLGANLVQLYTGFVYKGPELIGDCVRELRRIPRAHR